MPTLDKFSWLVIAVLVALLLGLRWYRSDSHRSYPDRNLTLIVPYSPGGGTDLLCRSLARAVEPHLGQGITINNITGGGGAVGFSSGQMARPDGYTVTAVTFELVSLPLQGLVPFTHEDFDLLMQLNIDPAAVTVRADFPANSLEEFLKLVRTRESPLSVGTSGSGSVWHLAGAQFAMKAGFNAKFVPFNGATPAITALVGGHIDAVTVSPGEVLSQVQAGQLKILGVMSEQRLSQFPTVPTCREGGIDVVFGTWRGLALPRGTPVDIKKTLTKVFRQGFKEAEFVELSRHAGLNLAIADETEFRRRVQNQSMEIAALMTQLGLKP